MGVQISVIGSGTENEARAEEVGRLVILEPGHEVSGEGVSRARTPEEAVEIALRRLA